MYLGVAPPPKDRRLFLCQQRQNTFCLFCLGLCTYQPDCGLMETSAGSLAVSAEPFPHQDLKHRVAHMCQADGADRTQLVIGKMGFKVVFHVVLLIVLSNHHFLAAPPPAPETPDGMCRRPRNSAGIPTLRGCHITALFCHSVTQTGDAAAALAICLLYHARSTPVTPPRLLLCRLGRAPRGHRPRGVHSLMKD